MTDVVRRSAFILIIICNSLFIHAQNLSQEDSIKAAQWMQVANAFTSSRSYDSAQFYFDKASEILKNNGKWREYYNARVEIARLYERRGQLKGAIPIVLEAQKVLRSNFDQINKKDQFVVFYAISDRLGYLNARCNDHFSSVDNYKRGIALTKQYLGIRDTTGNLARSYQNVATAFVEIDDFDNAIVYYDSAVYVLRIAYDYNPELLDLEAVIYLNKSRLMRDFGFWDEALSALNHANEIYNSLDPKDLNSYDMGYLQMAYAMFYSTRNLLPNDNEDARKHAFKSYSLFRENERHKIYFPYLEYVLAESFSNEQNYENSIKHYHKAIHLNQQLYGEEYGEIGYCYTNLGKIYQNTKQWDSAGYYLRKSVELYSNIHWDNKNDIAESYINLSSFQLEQENFDKALESIQLGLKAVVPSTSSDVLSNPEVDKLYPDETLANLMKTKAEIAGVLLEKSFDESYALVILDCYDKIIDYAHTPLNSRASAKSKSQYFENKYTVFEEALNTSLKLYDKTQNEAYLLRALNYSEKSKANSLREKIARSRKVEWQIPNELLEQKSQLNLKLNDLRKRYAGNEEKDLTLSSDILKIKEQLTNLENILRSEYPQYFNIQFSTDLSLARLQNSLPDNSLLIEYFVGKNSIYAFSIGEEIKALKFGKESLGQIDNILTDIKNRTFDYKNANSLYKGLLSELIDNTEAEQLIIVPDRQIGLLPFEVLTTFDQGSYRYLVEEYTIDYYPSISLLINQKQSKSEPFQSMLAVAPEYGVNSNTLIATRASNGTTDISTLVRLPYAKEEVQRIAEIFEGRQLIGSSATESNFKKELPNTDIIHLAAHTLIDDRNPLYSKLVLAKDSIEDGLLYAYELYGMNINAQLVSLSACNTGYGEYYGGEGVMSLARGFMYAGVPNVLMSLWAVPDRSTSEMMTSFYNHLKSGKTKSESLREAKIEYLQKADPITSQPYYWAGFVMMTQPEEEDRTNGIFWVLGFSVFLIIAIAVVRSRSNSNK